MSSQLLRSAVFAAVALASPGFAADDPPRKKLLEVRLRPVLVEQCYGCQSAETDTVLARQLYLDLIGLPPTP